MFFMLHLEKKKYVNLRSQKNLFVKAKSKAILLWLVAYANFFSFFHLLWQLHRKKTTYKNASQIHYKWHGTMAPIVSVISVFMPSFYPLFLDRILRS